VFLGTIFYNLDEKGRVQLPPRFRLSLGERFIITCGLRHSLSIYTLDGFQKISSKLEATGDFNPSANLLRRVFAGGAEEVSTDAQGRLTIPAPLREFAELKTEVVLLGSITKIEIWSRERWSAFCRDLSDEQLEDAARELDLD